jgi:hypothetical protein
MPENTPPQMELATDSPSLQPSVLIFTPEQIVQAIAFHLLDENRAKRVALISLHQTRDRLKRQHVSVMIARRQWIGFSNTERLEWLLLQSKTHAVYSGDMAVLSPKK